MDKLAELYRYMTGGDYVRDVAFVRDGVLRRELVLSEKEFLDFVSRHLTDVYMELFSYRQLSAGIYNAIFIDIDAHDGDLERAYDRYIDVAYVLDINGYNHVDFFSGRGFHIYLFFDNVRLNCYRCAVMKWASSIIVRGRKLLDLIDKNAFARSRQLVRIPYTVNSKVGLYVIPVKTDMFLKEIVDLAKEGDIAYSLAGFVKNDLLVKELVEFDFEESTFSEKKVEEERKILSRYFRECNTVDCFPECIKSWIYELIETGELDHYQRLNLAIFLLAVWGKEKTEKLLSLANDYLKFKTEYQLDYLARRGIYMYSCRRIRDELGACPFTNQRECPFFPWLEPWLPRGDVGESEE